MHASVSEDVVTITIYDSNKADIDILNKLNCKAEECIMIGNDVDEDMVASNLGIKTFLLTDCLINKNNKPYIIMEGIVDSNMKKVNKTKKTSKFIVMYAGALREEYGLKILIDGYMKYKNDNSELWIYGAGDYSEEIVKMSKIDERIRFFGSVDNETIIKSEHNASLLVNPRPTNLEFTRYSFPSKIMEYMSSGTPVLTTKLPTKAIAKIPLNITSGLLNPVFGLLGNNSNSA